MNDLTYFSNLKFLFFTLLVDENPVSIKYVFMRSYFSSSLTFYGTLVDFMQLDGDILQRRIVYEQAIFT